MKQLKNDENFYGVVVFFLGIVVVALIVSLI